MKVIEEGRGEVKGTEEVMKAQGPRGRALVPLYREVYHQVPLWGVPGRVIEGTPVAPPTGKGCV